MPIDYTKRPRPADQPSQPPPAAPPAAQPPVSLSKVVLTKAAPSVSLTKHGSTSGLLRVNLNWNARPAGEKVGLFRSAPQPIDLDLGCLYEFADGSRGVVQALGNAFSAQPRSLRERVIWLDGDDRSGTNSGGENLFINLDHADQIRRVMVFALIYEGVPNWAAADGVVTLYPASGPQIEVRLDDSTDGTRICGVAMLEHTGPSSGSELTFRREVRYLKGSQRTLDEAYGFGLRWSVGHK